jgi:hypothetical protein
VWGKRGTSCTNWRTEISVGVFVLAILVSLRVEALVVGGKPDEVGDVEEIPAYVNGTCEIGVRFKIW